MLRTVLALQMGLILIVVLLTTWVGLNTIRQSREAHRTTIALCALGDNIHRGVGERAHKIATTESFLKTHPKGIPGVPVKLLEQGLAADKASLRSQKRNDAALSVLHCPS